MKSAKLAVKEKKRIESIVSHDASEMIGVNTRVHLAQAEKIMRARINQAFMVAGVTLVDLATTFIDAGIEIGADTTMEPNTHLRGKTKIGTDCRIGANTVIFDSKIGDHCEILSSDIAGAIVEENVRIGPFARLRAGAHLARGVKMGNFGEVKNSYVGEESHIGHFCYIGDNTPGVNALEGVLSEDEQITRRILTEDGAVLVVQIADARNLRRALMLTWQIARIGKQMILVLNLADEARAHGSEIDTAGLERELGVPVVETVAVEGRGLNDLRAALTRAAVPTIALEPGRLRAAFFIYHKGEHHACPWH